MGFRRHWAALQACDGVKEKAVWVSPKWTRRC